MKILIYGAGVIGTIYSSNFHNKELTVTLLARGKSYKNLKKMGSL